MALKALNGMMDELVELIEIYSKDLDRALSGRLEVRGSSLSVFIALLYKFITDLEAVKEKQNED